MSFICWQNQCHKLYGCTSDGLNIYLNQQWVNYTGLSLEESYGNGWIKSFHLTTKSALDGQNAIANNTAYSLECRMRHKMVLIFGG
jgi:PAS domain-containing protein